MTSATATNINRSNSFVNALKWWPLQGHNHQSNHAAHGGGGGTGGGGGGGCVSAGPSTASGLSLLGHLHSKTSTFGSSVAVQKLRESKWFKRDEQRIFCAVVECGFIVEVRSNTKPTTSHNKRTLRSNSSGSGGSGVDEYDLDVNNDEEDEEEETLQLAMRAQDENETPMTSWFGIVLCKTAKDNKPKPETIEIYTVKIRENGTFKMLKLTLEDIWNQGWELRINNFADKEKSAHNEKDIRNQVSFARKAKHSLWNNNKHFVYWCRYGSRQQDVRKRQMSECVKWGSVGMNAGMILLMNKQKSYSTSK
ncbi:uncharacterized protein LOC126760317 [Bactrocera neohumeralis]|uniref:uncharacterized protein LOC120775914 n=1 Tax=Bactrocera tryoni TaxID=59916 RepID=UPI001A9840C8|nr:uncharacterized protein LOC120775914 [Bactrocera tryoni]XP_050331832.1 uncharacterized protein LOC126760317 [Bactrocera neohumeralis]